MAKKKKKSKWKNIAKAAIAAGAAYGMSKAMAGKGDWRSDLKHTYGRDPIIQDPLTGDGKGMEKVYGATQHARPKMLGDYGKSMDHMSGVTSKWTNWLPWNKRKNVGTPNKKAGGTIKAYKGQLVKSETRGTGAAVKGTTHEVMPGMNAAKHGKMIKARGGTEVRTRGSNPDNPYVTQGGEVQVATKLNGVLTTRTW